MRHQAGGARAHGGTVVWRLHRLLLMLEQGRVDEADLAQMEERDGVFPDVDPGALAG